MQTIAFINQTLDFEFGLFPWIGMVQETRKHNINLMTFVGGGINQGNNDINQANIIYDLVKSKKIDGLITWKGHLTGSLNENEIKEFYSSYPVPLITIEGKFSGFPCVSYGNFEGIVLSVQHLVDVHNIKKIGYLGLIENHEGLEERFRGYREGLKSRNINYDEGLVKPWVSWISSYDGQSSNKLLDDWLKKTTASGTKAFIAAGEPIAAWMIERLASLGMSVPEDVVVTAFDGFPEYQILNTPITTVDPFLKDVGRIAVQKMLDLLNNKKIPELTIVPPKLIISRSCGCQEKNVLNAQFQKINILKKIFLKEDYYSKIKKLFKTEQNRELSDVLHNLYQFFYKDINRNKSNRFIGLFDQSLRRFIKNEKNINQWQELITIFQKSLSGMFLSRKKLVKSYSICHQARILVSNTLNRIKEQKRNEDKNKKNTERDFGMQLSNTFDLPSLSNAISESLVSLNIRSCYLALYENPAAYRFPDAVPEWSNLILAHTNGKRVPLDKEGLRFKSREIIPDHVMPKNFVGSYCMFPIFFRENQIGFVVYESDMIEGSSYNFVTNQIANSLQETLLIQKINKHSEILEKGIEELSSGIEEMTGNIETINTTIKNQNSAVCEEASSIEEMRNNIIQIAEMTTNSKEISIDLDKIAIEGNKSIMELTKYIKDIQAKSQNILTLLNMIQEISDQTKLLAFNASIEAVHAGNKGVGFSVVSKEIRKLAETTEKNIHGITGEVNILMEKIDSSSVLSNQTIAGLKYIIAGTEKNSGIISQLDFAMKEQNQGTTQIMKTTEELVNLTSEITNAISEQLIVTHEFRDSIVKLKDIV